MLWTVNVSHHGVSLFGYVSAMAIRGPEQDQLFENLLIALDLVSKYWGECAAQIGKTGHQSLQRTAFGVEAQRKT